MKALAFDPDARYSGAKAVCRGPRSPSSKRLTDQDPRTFGPRKPSQVGPSEAESSTGLIVAASVLCVALGMSLNIAGRPKHGRCTT